MVLVQHSYAYSYHESPWVSWITEPVSSLNVLRDIARQYHALTYANSIRTVHRSSILPFHIHICHQLMRAMKSVPSFTLAV
jgi:hypothetical protein